MIKIIEGILENKRLTLEEESALEEAIEALNYVERMSKPEEWIYPIHCMESLKESLALAEKQCGLRSAGTIVFKEEYGSCMITLLKPQKASFIAIWFRLYGKMSCSEMDME